jgi:hypothetical protein
MNAARSEAFPSTASKAFGRRRIPHAGFAAFQDDMSVVDIIDRLCCGMP